MDEFCQVMAAQRELGELQKKFNQTFGLMNVCSLEARYGVILALVRLDSLRRQIAENRDGANRSIGEFLRIRNSLRDVFNMLEEHKGERRI